MPFRTIPDESYAEAESMLQNGATLRDTSQATGISITTLSKRFGKRKPDPKPGGNKPRRTQSSKAGPTDEQLISFYTKGAVAPAIPAGLWLRCDFCAMHFVNEGPKAAAKLVELSHDQPALRRVMEMLWQYGQEAAWIALFASWLGIPLAHHLAPDWVYRWIQVPLGMPPRGVEQPFTHAHQGEQNGNGATPPPTPFAGMDIESLMRMAQSMGVEFEMPTPPADADVTDADTQTTDEATAATAPEGDAPEAAASDQDASE